MFSSLCLGLLKILGWKFDGQLDKTKPCVIIVGPHTSNWDFIIGIIARSALGTKIHFLGKHQLFIPPWGWLFRAMGGSPVDRRKPYCSQSGCWYSANRIRFWPQSGCDCQTVKTDGRYWTRNKSINGFLPFNQRLSSKNGSWLSAEIALK